MLFRSALSGCRYPSRQTLLTDVGTGSLFRHCTRRLMTPCCVSCCGNPPPCTATPSAPKDWRARLAVSKHWRQWRPPKLAPFACHTDTHSSCRAATRKTLVGSTLAASGRAALSSIRASIFFLFEHHCSQSGLENFRADHGELPVATCLYLGAHSNCCW